MTDISTDSHTIRVALTDIAHEWPFLMADIAHSGVGNAAPNIGGKGNYAPAAEGDGSEATHDGPPLPGGTQRQSIAAGIRALCAYWARAVLDEHACATATLYADDVLSTATWLTDHTAWIASQDDGPEAAEEFRILAGQIKGVTREKRVKRTAIGPCPHKIDGNDCHGTVRARFGHEDGDRDVVCDINPDHAWDAHRWMQLARDMDVRAHRDTPPAKMTSDELAEWMSERFKRTIKAATIRKWVQRNPDLRREGDEKLDRIEVVKWYIDWTGARSLSSRDADAEEVVVRRLTATG